MGRPKGLLYTNNFLISEVKRFYEENGKIPLYYEFNPTNGYPSSRTCAKYFGTWNKLIEASGFKVIRGYCRDEEFLINELLRFETEFGRIPTQRDMRRELGYPGQNMYFKIFGNWINVIKITPFKNKVKYWDWSPYLTKEKLINEFLRFENENGRLPLPTDMINYKGYPSSNAYEKIFGSWANAIKETPFVNRIDEYFFSLNNMNLRKWYIIGYIIGDGYVNGNVVTICTTEKDKNNLFNMYKYMNLQTKIHEYKSKRNDINEQIKYTLNCTCKQWILDLSLFGIIRAKTFISHIPLEFIKTKEDEAAICRGIFDSDGFISYKKTDKFKPKCGIVGSEQLCKDYAYLLEKNCQIKINVKRHSSIYQITINGFNNCQKVYNFLYGHDNFYIERKKTRFEKLLNCSFNLEDDKY